MDKEERELQIKLAKLQADVQIWLATSLALIAVCGGLLIAGYQIDITSVTPNLNGLKTIEFIITGLALVAFGVLAAISVNKTDKYRKEMDKL